MIDQMKKNAKQWVLFSHSLIYSSLSLDSGKGMRRLEADLKVLPRWLKFITS